MSSDGGKPPPAPDPERIIALQQQYNRYNTSNPFGSQSWSEGEDGRQTLNTEVSPQMQGSIDRAFAAAETPYEKQYVPQGMDQLSSAIMGKVGKRYGLEGDALNTNLKQQYQPPPEVQGMGMGSNGGDPMQAMQAMQQAMQGMRAPQGGVGAAMGGMMMPSRQRI